MKLKPYPKYRDSGVPWLGDVPEHWEVRRLKNICTNPPLYGANIPASLYQESGVRFIRTNDITDMGELKKKGVYVDEKSVYSYILKNNDFLISRSGTVGRTFLFNDHKHEKSAYAGYLVKFTLAKFISSKYLFYYSKSRCFLSFVEIFSISSTINNLNGEKYSRMNIPFPPFSEQQQIARYLDWKTAQINKFIRNKRRLIQLLKEQKQNIINQAVTKGINPNVEMKDSGVEWLGQIPAHWEVRKITHLFRKIGSGTTPNSGNVDYYEGNIPWIISGDLTDGLLNATKKKITAKALQDYPTLKIYPEDSLVIAMYGATIGKVSLTTIRACTNQACCALSQPLNIVDMKFMLQLFISIKPNLVNMGYGGGQPNISQDIIKSLRLPIPPISEQQEIVTYIEKETALIDKTISRTEREIELIQEYRTRLVSDVVTGKLDVRGIEIPDFEPVEADLEVEGDEELEDEEIDEDE